MKTQLRTGLLTLAVGLGWFLPQSGQAFYNPSTGRWLSRDPVEEKAGVALYAFVRNNPTCSHDLLGRLELTSFLGPVTPGPCGQFYSWITWSLDSNRGSSDPIAGGTIVQYVSASFSVRLCDRASSPFTFGGPSTVNVSPGNWPFYEAWYIPPGQHHPPRVRTPAVDDVWSMPSFGEGTKGSITITATAGYYDGQTLPLGFSPGNAGYPGNSLPTSSFFDPPGPATSTVTRTMTATWNCCCHIENTRVARN
jgi:hypothetical protein